MGTDDQSEDDIKRLVDFLLEVELDLAEFTIMTPFPHTPVRAEMEKDGRILHNDWIKYTGSQTVFKPAKMSVDKLDELHQYAWDAFMARAEKNLQWVNFIWMLFSENSPTAPKSPNFAPRQR